MWLDERQRIVPILHGSPHDTCLLPEFVAGLIIPNLLGRMTSTMTAKINCFRRSLVSIGIAILCNQWSDEVFEVWKKCVVGNWKKSEKDIQTTGNERLHRHMLLGWINSERHFDILWNWFLPWSQPCYSHECLKLMFR